MIDSISKKTTSFKPDHGWETFRADRPGELLYFRSNLTDGSYYLGDSFDTAEISADRDLLRADGVKDALISTVGKAGNTRFGMSADDNERDKFVKEYPRMRPPSGGDLDAETGRSERMARREESLRFRPLGVDEILYLHEILYRSSSFFGKTAAPPLKKARYGLNREPIENSEKSVQCSFSGSTASNVE